MSNFRKENAVRPICISLIWVGGALVLANQFMREQRRYRAFDYCRNGSFSSYEDMEEYVDSVEKTLLPKSFLGRVSGWLHWGKLVGRFYPVSVNCFSYLCNQIQQFIFALELMATEFFDKVRNVAFPRNFFRNHKRSSPFSMLDKKKMDDGGRHGNVSPDSFTVRSPENANAGGVPAKQLQPEDLVTLKSVSYSALFQEVAKHGFARTNGEARRLVRGGGIWVNGEKATDENMLLMSGDVVSIRHGRSNQRAFTVCVPVQDETQAG